MSEEAYYSFLKDEGLPTKDSETLKRKYWASKICDEVNIMKMYAENAFGAKMFVNGFGELEIENAQFNFTYAGKQLLRRLVKVECIDVWS